MNQYIARQPVFSADMEIYAYELLYRGAEMTVQEEDGHATTSLLSGIFLERDVEDVALWRPCFINFTQDLLEKNVPAMFPSDKVMVEVLESVQPTEKVLEVCRQLRQEGYTIALDDFTYSPEIEPLLKIANIVKIDFQATTKQERLELLERLRPFKVKLLAEKVEEQSELEEAAELGFDYFQGYFFAKPVQLEMRQFSVNEALLVRLLVEINKPENDFEAVKEIISADPAVSYGLLRFINSAFFYKVQPISSIAHAIVYLGEKELRRFVMFMVISELAQEKPTELVRTSLVRAKFCESITELNGWAESECAEMFLVGLFSLIDVILGMPMAHVFRRLPVAESVSAALLQRNNSYARYLMLIEAVEQDNSERVDELCGVLGIRGQILKDCYMIALRYVNEVL